MTNVQIDHAKGAAFESRLVGMLNAGALSNSRTVVMPGQRHIAMDTAPDLVVDAVLEFWRDVA